MVAMGTSLVYSMAGDVLCRLLMEVKGYSYEDFKATHPVERWAEDTECRERSETVLRIMPHLILPLRHVAV